MTAQLEPAPTGVDQDPGKIRAMFAGITPSYDRLNHLLSGWLDHYWRYVAARELTAEIAPCARVLDVATGTGDLAHAIANRVKKDVGRAPMIAGLDFTGPMVREAQVKYGRAGHGWFHGDGLALPFADGAFDAASISFGLRNMADRAAGIGQMMRVVRGGGRIAILEFSQPPNRVWRALYDFYSFHVLPRIGALISGSDAYRYLAESVRAFPGPIELEEIMRGCGLVKVRHLSFLGGIVCLHLGDKV